MITNQFTTQPFAPKTWERTADGFLRVKARVLAERVMPYAVCELSGLPEELASCEVVQMLVDRSSMSTGEALRTLESAQVTAPDHLWITPDNAGAGKGNAVGAPRLDGPYLEVDLLITDPQAIADIESGRIGEISAGYHADTIFEAGDFDGVPYQARQTALRFNHIAVIPTGTGRAGSDVRIINQQKKEGDTNMPEPKIVRVQLRNTKRFVNVDEETANAIAAEETATEEVVAGSGKKLEELMTQVEDLNAQIAALQAEAEEGKGELSVYKEKLDELLSTEAIEHAAMGMVAESAEAEEIIENSRVLNEKGEEDEKEKEKVLNSLKGLHGTKLHQAVLTAVGVKCENMSPEALRGAFKAQNQIVKAGAAKVSGARLMNRIVTETPTGGRTSMQRLGFK